GEIAVGRERVVAGRGPGEVARDDPQPAVGTAAHGMGAVLAAAFEFLEKLHFVKRVVAIRVADAVEAAPLRGAAVHHHIERALRAKRRPRASPMARSIFSTLVASSVAPGVTR